MNAQIQAQSVSNNTYAILGTGPSMNAEIAEFVRTRCRAIAVGAAYRLAPWADALVCRDAVWWESNSDAVHFAGRKFRGARFVDGAESTTIDEPGCNSGLLAMRIAHQVFGATRILLLGFDMHGDHFFGKHESPLRNTTPGRFQTFIKQFQQWRGCEVINCTPSSALKQFPFGDICEILGGRVEAIANVG